jgi:hypothetical protein
MSPEGQFIWFLIALILIVIASVMSFANKAWTFALLTAGLAAYVLVFMWNAMEAM